MENEELRRPGERVRDAAQQVRGGVSARLGSISRALTIKAVLLAVLGVCVIFWPSASIQFLLWAAAALLIVDGLAGFLSLFGANERGAFLGQSLVSIAVGVAMLLWPGASLRTLTLLLGAWALLQGATLLWSLRSLDAGDAYRNTQRIVGIVLAVIGAVLLFWPNIGVIAISWIVGIAALVIAALLFWLVSRLNGVRSRIEGPAA